MSAQPQPTCAAESYTAAPPPAESSVERITISFQTLELLTPAAAVPMGGPGAWLTMLGLLLSIGAWLQRPASAQRLRVRE